MTTPTHLLALDQGTSSSRAIVFDLRGNPVATAQRELTQFFPQPGWVEHDADEIWASQLATARDAMAQAGLKAQQIAAIGITNQRETVVLWNRHTGQAVHHALVWQDRRTEPLCAELRARGLQQTVREKTGLVIDPYFSGTKLKWLLDHVPGARALARRGDLAFGTVDSWLLWNLTRNQRSAGVHATDVSNASRTMLFNLRTQDWDDELLSLLDIPREVLPLVRPSSFLHGHTTADLFGAAVPIGALAGDQQSALFGQACFTPGMAKNTYGTGCFMLMHSGAAVMESRHGLISTQVAQTLLIRPDEVSTSVRAEPVEAQFVRATLRQAQGERFKLQRAGSITQVPGLATAAPQFALEGSVFMGGAVVQWLRDGLRVIESSDQVQALADSVSDSGGVIMVPAFAGLGAPYWQPDARGAILGLTRGSTTAHIARAALESIAFQSAALLMAMNNDAQAAGLPPVTELRVDGGASRNNSLMQFQADVLGLPVLRPRVRETTALGAAWLAGLACGVYRSPQELAPLWQLEHRFEPQMAPAQAATLMANWERAVRQTTGP